MVYLIFSLMILLVLVIAGSLIFKLSNKLPASKTTSIPAQKSSMVSFCLWNDKPLNDKNQINDNFALSGQTIPYGKANQLGVQLYSPSQTLSQSGDLAVFRTPLQNPIQDPVNGFARAWQNHLAAMENNKWQNWELNEKQKLYVFKLSQNTASGSAQPIKEGFYYFAFFEGDKILTGVSCTVGKEGKTYPLVKPNFKDNLIPKYM